VILGFELGNQLLEIIASSYVETIVVLVHASKINIYWLHALVYEVGARWRQGHVTIIEVSIAAVKVVILSW
jgi:hypothetical protein